MYYKIFVGVFYFIKCYLNYVKKKFDIFCWLIWCYFDSGIIIEYVGECGLKFVCVCLEMVNKVCGNDGKIYDNDCFLECMWVKLYIIF